MKKILLIDDEENLTGILRFLLEKKNYRVYIAHDGKSAIESLIRINPDLIILDLILPDMYGEDLLKKIDTVYNNPVLICTAQRLEDEFIDNTNQIIELITKPFINSELLDIVEKLLFCKNKMLNLDELEIGELSLSLKKSIAKKNGEVINLNFREYKLLEYLARHINKKISNMTLFKAVWKGSFSNNQNVVDKTFLRLQKKIEDNPSCPQYLFKDSNQEYVLCNTKLGVKK